MIGIISDTHGQLRPEAVEALRGSALILHAGDIGLPEVLEELGRLAPVAAVKGNNDFGAWAGAVPARRALDAEGLRIHIVHDLGEFEGDPRRYDVIVSGHSHRPLIREADGVLYVNPGSAGPRRFKLPVTVARLQSIRGRPRAEIFPLRPRPGAPQQKGVLR